MQERRVVRVAVQHRAIHGHVMMVNPAALGVEEHAEIGAPIRRVLLQFVVALEERRHADPHGHGEPLRVLRDGQLRQRGKVKAADEEPAPLARGPVPEDKLQLMQGP